MPPSSAAGHTVGARSSLRRAPRAPCWQRRRAPTDAITPSSAATHRPSPRRLLEPTRRRRPRAEPRTRRSLVTRGRPCRARADRVVERRVRRVGCAAKRRPTSPRPASLLLSAHRRAGSTSPHEDDEQALSRERVVPPLSATGHPVGVRSSLLRAPRAPRWQRRRTPTDVITPSSAATRRPSPRRRSSSRHDDGDHAPSREHVVPWSRAADLAERAPIVSPGATCTVLAAPPSADQCHYVQLRCCSLPIAAPALRAPTTTTSER